MIMNIYEMREMPALFNVTHIISAFDITFNKDHHVKAEIHNFWELVYVQEGTIGVTANDQILELQKGQIIFHKPGELHNLWSAEGSTPTVFIFTFCLDRELKKLENMRCSLLPKEQLLIEQLREETHVFETLVDEDTTLMHIQCHAKNTYGIDHSVKNYVELLLIQIIKNHHKGDPLPIQKGSSYTHYQKISAYIQANLFTKVNIDMICENCNVSPTTLKNIFKKYVGLSAMEYVNQLKIQAAISLLEQGLTHQEIADRLAFSSPYYFSTVFKRVMGSCPKDFRNTPSD
ncbi:MAG: helix-turn-helix domain-containing protein [Cellulosilyticaceae bacterium]